MVRESVGGVLPDWGGRLPRAVRLELHLVVPGGEIVEPALDRAVEDVRSTVSETGLLLRRVFLMPKDLQVARAVTRGGVDARREGFGPGAAGGNRHRQPGGRQGGSYRQAPPRLAGELSGCG